MIDILTNTKLTQTLTTHECSAMRFSIVFRLLTVNSKCYAQSGLAALPSFGVTIVSADNQSAAIDSKFLHRRIEF